MNAEKLQDESIPLADDDPQGNLIKIFITVFYQRFM